jgi:hypothetical protein
LRNVFYSASNKEYVSCDGRILLVEKTNDAFGKNMMFNPVTCQSCDDQDGAGVNSYPFYERMIPDYPEVTFKSYKLFKRKAGFKDIAKDVIFSVLGIKRFSSIKLIDTAIRFISENGRNFKVHADSKEKPIMFESKGRTAVVMPIRDVSKEKYLEISSGTEYSPKTEKTKTTTVFVATNANGDIVGAFFGKARRRNRK